MYEARLDNKNMELIAIEMLKIVEARIRRFRVTGTNSWEVS